MAGAVGARLFLGAALSLLGPSPAEGQVLREIEFKAPSGSVNQVAFSPDGKTLASVASDNDRPGAGAYVRLWDVKTGKEKAKFRLETPSPGYLLAFTPDGKTLVSCCASSGPLPAQEGLTYIEVWDIKTGKRRLLIRPKPAQRGHKGCVCPDGKTLVVTAGDASVALYDLQTGKEVAVLSGQKDVLRVVVSRDGKWLATSCAKGKLGIWDLGKRKLLHLFDAQKAAGFGMAFRPDGKQVATVGEDGVLNVWDRATADREARVDLTANVDLRQARSVHFTPDGGTLVVSGRALGDAIVWWELVGGRLRGSVDPRRAKAQDHRHGALSPDGKLLATVNQRTIQLWELREKPKKP